MLDSFFWRRRRGLFKNHVCESGLLCCFSKSLFSPILQKQQGDLPKLTLLPLSTVHALTLFWQLLISCRAERNIGSTASFLPGRARDRMNCDFFPWDTEGWLVRNETGRWLLFTEGQVHEQCATLAPSSSWTRLKINQNSKGRNVPCFPALWENGSSVTVWLFPLFLTLFKLTGSLCKQRSQDWIDQKKWV